MVKFYFTVERWPCQWRLHHRKRRIVVEKWGQCEYYRDSLHTPPKDSHPSTRG